jgi:hypothetical protein
LSRDTHDPTRMTRMTRKIRCLNCMHALGMSVQHMQLDIPDPFYHQSQATLGPVSTLRGDPREYAECCLKVFPQLEAWVRVGRGIPYGTEDAVRLSA